MRIGRLDLVRYGRFAGVSLSFPRGAADLHVIYGPNEAGKSTSLAAIEDWLFGIGMRSPYNFLYEHASLRVGGVLESDGGVLEMVRRKGNKDTLLSAAGTPLSPEALAPYLHGVTREFFTRMMSLDHERLNAGGREILEARNEIGQMLFAAGTGLSGLRAQLSSLEQAADALWAPRRAAHRRYYVALDALEAAEQRQRAELVTASEWVRLRRDHEQAEVAYEQLREQIESSSAEQRRLDRIRRVYRRIAQLADIEHELGALGEPAPLPEDAQRRLSDARASEVNAQTQIDVLLGQLAQHHRERDTLHCDATLLQLGEAIERMHRSRIEVHKERADLPKRQAEYATKAAELAELAEGLGWGALASEAITARLPPRVHVTTARTLLNQRAEYFGAEKSAEDSLSEAREQREALLAQLAQMPPPRDITQLSLVLSAARGRAEQSVRLQASEREVRTCEAKMATRLQALRPSVDDTQSLVAIEVPARTAVEAYREQDRELNRRMQECRDQLEHLERDLTLQREAFERRAREQEGMAPQALRSMREERERGWQLIRRRYIAAEPVPPDVLDAYMGAAADLASAYEERVHAADSLADRRFENAQAAGEMALRERQIADQALERDRMGALAEDLRCQREDFALAWRALWARAPFEPLAPEQMLEWLEARAEILGLVESRAAAQSECDELRREEARASAALIAALTAIGEAPEGFAEQSINFVMERAAAAELHQRALSQDRASLTERIRSGAADVTRKAARLQQAQAGRLLWEERWRVALSALGLSGELPAQSAMEQIEVLERMRALVVELKQLQRERIEKIEQDIAAFAVEVTRLTANVAPELQAVDPEQAAIELERRLATSRLVRERQRQMDQAIEALQTRVQECEAARGQAEQAIQMLLTLAGATDPLHLQVLIQRGERIAQLRSERLEIESQLASDGDGLPRSVLQAECAQADLDQIAARAQTLHAQQRELQERLAICAERRQSARQALEAIGGGAGAVQAAAERQEALAAMREVAERYVRVASSATVLRWAIDRFRRERQAPLLSRAGHIFAQLTSQAFRELNVEYDAQDRPVLMGVRADGAPLDTAGMSDGTRDQLFLALRLASVHEYLDSGAAVPFVADDLLVNFDDERATAGLRALATLAARTQVLCFTHHRHLTDIARTALGNAANIISLPHEGAR